MKASFFTRKFDFKFPAGTSRGVLYEKNSSFILLEETQEVIAIDRTVDTPRHITPNIFRGIGECSTLPGLSPDPMDRYEDKLKQLCEAINDGQRPYMLDLTEFPSIQFGLEMALQELLTAQQGCLEMNVRSSNKVSSDFFPESPHLLFPSDFTSGGKGITINGLIWMGDQEFMNKQIVQKLADGFRCLKLKVGALDFDTELSIIKGIRKHFSPNELELRLDANGAFNIENVLGRLNRLSKYNIHSVEQPIRQGQHDAMAMICRTSPIPVALDEELISVPVDMAEKLLLHLCPAYIILKPSLLGGFAVSQHWIDAAEKTGIKWWVTSALESNIGLNAIAQWTFTLNNPLPQGLGTGQIYKNNFTSPLYNKNHQLMFNNQWLSPGE